MKNTKNLFKTDLMRQSKIRSPEQIKLTEISFWYYFQSSFWFTHPFRKFKKWRDKHWCKDILLYGFSEAKILLMNRQTESLRPRNTLAIESKRRTNTETKLSKTTSESLNMTRTPKAISKLAKECLIGKVIYKIYSF